MQSSLCEIKSSKMNAFQGFIFRGKRKRQDDFNEVEEYFQEKRTRSDDDIDAVVVSVSSMAAALCNPKERKERSPKKYREQSWWTNGYGN